ncbi:MAG: hypothetical protein Q9191_002934 [Dirinaria sp. TL-2023a]
MLEGSYSYRIDLKTVLDAHGQTLQKLIWDTKSQLRSNPDQDVSFHSPWQHLAQIGAACPDLVELGVSLDWDDIVPFRDSITDSFDLMKLRILNIRNMPVADRVDSYTVSEAMLQGLAITIVRLYMGRIPQKSSSRPLLRIIALGSLSYRDRYLGGHPSDDLDRFFQRRNYHVDYVENYQKKPAPLLTLTSKGCVCNDEFSEQTSVLDPYWLA